MTINKKWLEDTVLFNSMNQRVANLIQTDLRSLSRSEEESTAHLILAQLVHAHGFELSGFTPKYDQDDWTRKNKCTNSSQHFILCRDAIHEILQANLQGLTNELEQKSVATIILRRLTQKYELYPPE
jgi:hypothetical protein